MGCTSSVSVPERKIVLLGKTGDGKSSAGNIILGENVFIAKASASNAGSQYQKTERKVHGRKMTVIDTPGDLDTDRDDEALKSESIKRLVDCAPGIDAFIVVLKVGRYTEHENEVIKKLLNTFNEEDVLKHTVILFTHGEQLEGKTIEEFMEECSHLQELVDKCGGRCHVIDSKYWNKRKRGYKSNRVQVKNLLETIDKMVEENGCFTTDLLQHLEKEIQEEIKNINEDNLHPEEQREKAEKNVHDNLLLKMAGAATGAVLGVPIAIVAAVAPVLYILKSFVTLKTAFATAGIGAAEGGAAGAAGGVGAGGAAAGGVGTATMAVCVLGATGAAVGGFTGWNAADEAESLYDAMTKAAVATWETGLYAIQKAEEMCGQMCSKTANLY